jgi:hypothetical protein
MGSNYVFKAENTAVHRYRQILKWAGATAMAVAAAVTLMQASAFDVSAGAADDAADIYLSQAMPVLADARANLDSLHFYLPLGSPKDENDPTWNTAELSAEALQEDADALKTLSPPDSLSATNAELVADLSRAGDSAEKAIDFLSNGDASKGTAALASLDASTQAFDASVNDLPPTQ